MKTKKYDYVNEQENSKATNDAELSIEEQLELFAEILIDQLLNDKQENEN